MRRFLNSLRGPTKRRAKGAGSARPNRFAREVISVLLFGVALLCAATRAVAQDAAILQRARQAALATRAGLQSGSATGTWGTYGADGNARNQVRFRAMFDGKKQYLHIEFLGAQAGKPPRDYKRIIVQDGSDTFMSRFSHNLSKTGAEGAIYPAKSLSAATGCIAHSLRQIVQGGFPAEGIDRDDVKVEKLPNGHYRCSYLFIPEEDYWTTYELAPEKGFNAVSHTELGGPRGRESGQKFFADWKKEGDRWYSNYFVEEVYMEGKIASRSEYRLDEFNPNVAVPAEAFTLNALELPGGSRILDQRSGGIVKVYRKEADRGEDVEARSERLVEQVEAMPRMYQADRTGRFTDMRLGRILGASTGLLGLALIVAIWFIHHRKGA